MGCQALAEMGKENGKRPHPTTVKLGLYVHGLVRTLGYYVLSVNHGQRQSAPNALDKTYFVYNVPFFISLEGT